MRKLALVLVLLVTAGCSTLGSIFSGKADPLPARNAAHVERLVAKDPDPADAALNADAVATAGELVSSYGQAPDFPALMRQAGSAAADAGIPWLAQVGALIGTLGAIFTTAKTLNRRAKGIRAGAVAARPPAAPPTAAPPTP